MGSEAPLSWWALEPCIIDIDEVGGGPVLRFCSFLPSRLCSNKKEQLVDAQIALKPLIATTLTNWHRLVMFCTLHAALWMKLFEHKPFEQELWWALAYLMESPLDYWILAWVQLCWFPPGKLGKARSTSSNLRENGSRFHFIEVSDKNHHGPSAFPFYPSPDMQIWAYLAKRRENGQNRFYKSKQNTKESRLVQ